MKTAFSRAWQTYRRHFGPLMLMLLIEIILRLMVCVPLLFLATAQTRALALLCLPMFVLIVLPARSNAATAYVALQETGRLPLTQLVSFDHYGKKVAQGLKRTGLMLLWALPFLAVTGGALYLYKAEAIPGVTDTFSLLQKLLNLGRSGAAAFFFGGISSITVRGVLMLVLLYLLTLVPLIIGLGFHSGTRHGEALGNGKMIHGHRGQVLGCWLVGLVTLLPFLAAAGWICSDYVHQLMNALSNIGMGSLSLPPLDSRAWLMGVALVVLLLPLIPFKQLLAACRVKVLQEAQK